MTTIAYTTSGWMTKNEAAAVLQISPQKIYRLVLGGYIETRFDINDGRRRLVSLTEIRRVLQMPEGRSTT